MPKWRRTSPKWLIGNNELPHSEQLPPDIIALVEAKNHDEMEKNSVPGLTVAIAWEGRIRYSKAFGLADVQNLATYPITSRYSL